MTDVASLFIKSDSTQIRASTKDLDKLAKSADEAEDETKDLSKGFGTVGSTLKGLKPLITGFITALGIKEIARVSIETENYNAILKTATGSTAAAAAEFDRLNGFARQTPFTLQQSIDGFVMLKNLGLDPSERAMASFGNTSAAMGKSLSQMIEAVADASTNEFERLKEFGIKAKQQGDDVTFTFRGVETTIKKSSENIQEFLIGIGETNFASAMSDQMNTVKGQASNVVQSFDDLLRVVGENADAQQIMKTALQGVADVIGWLTAHTPAFFEQLQLIGNFIRGSLVNSLDHLIQGFEGVQIIMDNWGDGLDVVGIKLEQNALAHDQFRKFVEEETVSLASNILTQEKSNSVVGDAIDMANEQANALSGATDAVTKQDKALTSLIDKLFPAEAQARKLKEQEQLLQGALETGTITWSKYSDALTRLNPVENEQIAIVNEQSQAINNLSMDYDTLTASVRETEVAAISASASLESISSGLGTTTHTGAVEPFSNINTEGRFGTGVVDPFVTNVRNFAQGGSFTVGGQGGVDSQPVNFMANPGERVTVGKKGDSTTNNGGPVTIIMQGVQNVKQFANELAQYSRTNPIALNIETKGVVSG